MNGKGSKRRPAPINHKAFARRWDRTFKRALTPTPGPEKESAWSNSVDGEPPEPVRSK